MQPGERFATRYELIEKVGAGGMGEVWRALDSELAREVAVKIMAPALRGAGDGSSRRFEREAKLAARVHHRNVVEIYDSGSSPDGSRYLVMPMLEGITLAARLADQPVPTVEELLGWFDAVLCGLEAIHDKQIVHRDLKPENIFLAREGDVHVPKLLDFGVSRGADDGPGGVGLTQTGAMLGTPRYMAPEQLKSAKDVDERADIYSVGVILYESLTGAPMFRNATTYTMLSLVEGQSYQRLEVSRPDLCGDLHQLVSRALSLQPGGRWESAKCMREALSEILKHGWHARPRWRDLERRNTSESLVGKVERARADVETAPQSSLGQQRAVLESVVRYMHLFYLKKEAGNGDSLNKMLGDGDFVQHLKMMDHGARLRDHMDSVRKHGNMGAHARPCNSVEADISMKALLEVIRYVFEDWGKYSVFDPDRCAEAGASPERDGEGLAQASEDSTKVQPMVRADPTAPTLLAPTRASAPALSQAQSTQAQSTQGRGRRGMIRVVALASGAVLLLAVIALGASLLLSRQTSVDHLATVASAPSPVAPTPVQIEAAEGAAMSAYRGSLAAHDRRQPERYFASYVDPMECFMGQPDYSLRNLHRLRDHEVREDAPAPRRGGSGLWSANRRILSSSLDEVVLMDWGVWHSDADISQPGGGVYEKLIVMRRRGEEWRIAAETDRAHAGCVDAAWFARATPPATWARCQARVDVCTGHCDSTCEACLGTCPECRSCTNACLCELAQCFGNRHSSFCD